MVSGIYICHWPDLDREFSRCEVLLHRSYHNDVPVPTIIVDTFSAAYLAIDAAHRTPFLYKNGITYISLWGDNDICLLAVARRNVNAMSVISLLSQLQSLISHYFQDSQKHANSQVGHKQTPAPQISFTRDAVVDNHALVFELLDECVDFGLAQVTDFNILKEYIKMEVNQSTHTSGDLEASDSGSDSDSPSYSRSSRSKKFKKQHKHTKSSDIKSTHNRAVKTDVVNEAAANYVNSSIVRTQVSAISWRPKGIFYPKNEIYIDLIEECEFLYDLESQEVRTNQINGVCLVRSYLSGMPVCKLGLNEKYISQVEFDEELDTEEEFKGNDPGEREREGNQLIQGEDENDEREEKDEAEIETEPEESQRLRPSSEPRLMKVPITNVQFHSCVELSKVYKENLIFFTPPDDEFRLFSYSVEQQRRKRVKPLLMVSPIYRVLRSSNKLQIMCTLHTNFRKKLHCNKVVVKLPVSPALFSLDSSHDENFRFKCEMGEVRFSVDSSEILWAIGDLPGSKKSVKLMVEFKLSESAHLTEESIAAELLKKPHLGNLNGHNYGNQTGIPLSANESDSIQEESTISELDRYYGVGHASSSVFSELQRKSLSVPHEISISFEMPLFTYSGLKVTYLRVDEDTMKYTCFPWVRYATRTSSGKNETQNPNLSDKPAAGNFRFKMGPSNFTLS